MIFAVRTFAYALLIVLTPYSVTSRDFRSDLDAGPMKHAGGGSEGVYVIRRGGSDECFADPAPKMTQKQVNKDFMRLRPRCISIGQLKGRYPLTPPTYLSGSLPDTLLAFAMGYLILRPASRLDAFSGYPIRT